MNDLQILNHYKTLLECDQFVLTGSAALKHLGLIETCSDLDVILVNPTNATLAMLQRLQEANPAKTAPKPSQITPCEAKAANGALGFIFMHEAVKIDIFISSKTIVSEVFVSGILLNPISQIIAAKKKFNRLKDLVQLRYLSRLFFCEDDLRKKLDYPAYPVFSGTEY